MEILLVAMIAVEFKSPVNVAGINVKSFGNVLVRDCQTSFEAYEIADHERAQDSHDYQRNQTRQNSQEINREDQASKNISAEPDHDKYQQWNKIWLIRYLRTCS
jgi:hypothetical protein